MNMQAERSLLRAKSEHGHHRVTFVELFFDLVFVFAITQISHSLLEHLTLVGAAQTFLLMLAVWWVWMYTSWATNWLDPDRKPVRLLLFALMAAGLVLSTSIPKAFETQGLAFAIAYACMQVVRTAFTLWSIPSDNAALKQTFQRIQIWFGVSAVLWIAGGLSSGAARFAWWSAAIVVEYLGPALRFWSPRLGAASVSDWTIEGGHMAERCALFIIIALGESILVTGATFGKTEWTAATFTAFAVAFIGTLAMWWIYFDRGAEEGSGKIAHAADPGRLGRLAYTYLHLPIVAGIIVSAVADELVLAHPGGHTDLKTAASVIGGPLFFLGGAILFKRAIRGWFMLSHLVGIAALIALAPFYALAPPLLFYAIATVILVVVATWEMLSLGSTQEA